MKRTFVFLTAIFLLLTACAPAAVQTEPPTEAPTEAPTDAPTEALAETPTEPPTEAPTEEPTEALPEETEAPTEPPERPEHTVTIQISVNDDCMITNAEGQTVRWEFDGSPEGDLLIYDTDLSGFGVGIDPMQSWEVAASDSFTFETSSPTCAFYAEIGDSYYSVSGTGVTGIEFRDGYIKLTGSEMTYTILTNSHARERQYFRITGTGTTGIEFPIEDVLAASPIGETYRVERCTV